MEDREDREGLSAPRALAVHDMSCFGRCALTVVMPVLAAMGVQPVPLPTAVLSTHTGGFDGIASAGLFDFMRACLRHFRAMGLSFDAVYSGYLADIRQVDYVSELIAWQRSLRPGALVVVDPVMGDEGALYSAMPAEMPSAMRALCEGADLITPNLTEAALLTCAPYDLRPRSPREALETLRALPGACALITGMPLTGGWANVCHRKGERGYWQCDYHMLGAHYPGTGDLFASLVVGALLRGGSVEQGMGMATAFVREAIARTMAMATPPREGVQFEAMLAHLADTRAYAPVYVEP